MQRVLSAAPRRALAVQMRRYEYWGITVSARTAPSAQGDQLPGLMNDAVAMKCDSDAQYLTGGNYNAAFSDEQMYDVAKCVNRNARTHAFHVGVQTYNVDPVNAKEVEVTLEAWEGLGAEKTAVWEKVFKSYPSLKKPLDEETLAEFVAFYTAAIASAEDEKAVAALAAPFVKKMATTKFISATYWWRFAEAIMDTLCDAPMQPRHTKRSVRLVVERVTKISKNTINDWDWASDDMVNPYTTDVCGHRSTHEAGFW
jgi:hypothetical protein